MEKELLELKGVRKYFKGEKGGSFKAVHHIDLSVAPGEWIGIVGESGCGKSTLARIICRFIDLDAGSISFKGQDITKLKGESLRHYYKSVQMIFQDPLSTFSPRMRIGDYLSEPFVNFRLLTKKEAAMHAQELLASVGLPPDFTKKYPHELSGGQLQRVVIARAVGLRPDLMICDECTSALDAVVQQQVIQHLVRLKKESQFANIFITHDLALAESVCERIYVMQAGEIVELLEGDNIVRDAQHPYTKQLIQAGFSLKQRFGK